MNFVYPAAYMGLIGVPVIVLLYLLKKKYRQQEVSSTLLWKKVLLSSHAKRPWQKFRKNILMILEILCLIMLLTALASPYISNNPHEGNYLLIVDNSYTMQASDVKPDRFTLNIENAVQFIDSTDTGSSFTVITAEKDPQIMVFNTADKNTVKDRIKGIELSHTGVYTEEILQMMDTFDRNVYDEIIVFSDKQLFEDDGQIQYVFVGESDYNLSIAYMNHSIINDRIVPFVRIKNHSSETVTAEVALYADNTLREILEVDLEAFEQKDIVFDSLEKSVVRLIGKILNQDIIEEDNYYYDVVIQDSVKKAVLFTEGNIFLENILALTPGLDVFKGNIEDIDIIDGYYLYIYDGVMPDSIPEDGHILVVNPPTGNSFIELGEKVQFTANMNNTNKNYLYLRNMDFNINKYSLVEAMPTWAVQVLSDGENPLILAGEENDQKYGVLLFDLFDTDLPLKKEFPVLMYQFADWYNPEKSVQYRSYQTGGFSELYLEPNVVSAEIEDPEGKNTVYNPTSSVIKEEFLIPGHYELKEILPDSEDSRWFCVNIDFGDSQKALVEDTALQREIESYYQLKWIFILGALLLILADWYLYSYTKIRIPDLLRTVLIVLMIVSLINPALKIRTRELNVVFAVDFSDSLSYDEEQIMEMLAANWHYENKNISKGLVAFGKNASVEIMPDKESEIHFQTYVNKSMTDIQRVLMVSAGVLDTEANKKIVLITDGNETVSDAISYGKHLASQSIELDILPVESTLQHEVQLTEIKVPNYVNLNVAFNVEIVIDSLSSNEGTLLLYRDNTLIETKEVKLSKGSNRFIFSDICESGGYLSYRAEIICSQDYFSQNNRAYGFSYIKDAPSVLVIGTSGSQDEIVRILDQTGIQVDSAEAYGAPASLYELSNYDLVVISDVSYDEISESFWGNLKNYVKAGGGLFVSGGENSYALGWYDDTELEEILPVNMELKDESIMADVAMIMVIDRSGSMDSGRYGMTKMELAKTAVAESIKGLLPGDTIGVLAFDTEPVWYAEPDKIENFENLEGKIQSISPGGGTSILPALQEAVSKIMDVNASYKHIILLTDGMAEISGYENVISLMNENNITMSAVAVGEDSDVKLLERLSENADGRYYYTDEFTDLPKIFLKETMMTGNTHLVNEFFYPTLGTDSAVLEGIEFVPPLLGYVNTTPKPRADVILYAKEDAPLLASWQYGLGRSVAFTSDLKGMWSQEFLQSEQGSRLVRNTVSWLLRTPEGEGITAGINENGNIEIYINDYDGVEQIKTEIYSDMGQVDMEFIMKAPGSYVSTDTVTEEGIYFLNVSYDKEDVLGTVPLVVNVPYSREYDITSWHNGKIILETLARVSGGRIIDSLENIYDSYEEQAYGKLELGNAMIIASIVLLLLDVAYRRLDFKLPKGRIRVLQSASEGTRNGLQEKKSILSEEKIKDKNESNINAESKKESTANKLLNSKRNREK